MDEAEQRLAKFLVTVDLDNDETADEALRQIKGALDDSGEVIIKVEEVDEHDKLLSELSTDELAKLCPNC